MASSITLADAAGTPVNHVFAPNGPDKDGTYWFVDPVGGNSNAGPLGFWRISVGIKRPALPIAGTSAQNRTYRVAVALHLPSLADLDYAASGLEPAPTVAYTPRAFMEFVIPERSIDIDRDNIRKMAYNLLNNAQVVSAIEDLIPVL
jgi:hypothetical protein